MAWTPEQKRAVWNKGHAVKGMDPAVWRKDDCGAFIKWDCYGKDQHDNGWEIDHICPDAYLERLGIPQSVRDDLRNLRPLQASNNATKGDDYPWYRRAVTAYNPNKKEDVTILCVSSYHQQQISDLLSEYLIG